MIWTLEKKYLMLQIITFGIIFILLLISQYTKEWFHFSKNSSCSWKGNFEEIYSSDCYTHKSYSSSKCQSKCNCCHSNNLASLTDLKGNTVCIYANFILIIIWVFTVIILNLVKIGFPFRYYWKVYSVIFLTFGIISCFLSGNSHPEKVELKKGYIFRITVILIFYSIGLAHLVYGCRLIWNGRDNLVQQEQPREMESPLRPPECTNGPEEVAIN
jgi:uncharacterized ion transporter superfamily protein YfcC